MWPGTSVLAKVNLCIYHKWKRHGKHNKRLNLNYNISRQVGTLFKNFFYALEESKGLNDFWWRLSMMEGLLSHFYYPLCTRYYLSNKNLQHAGI